MPLDEGSRLRIMNDDQILTKLYFLVILFIIFQIGFKNVFFEIIFLPLQRIVESFGDFKERFVSLDDIP